MNLIKYWSEFILNETLKTHDIDLTVKKVESELSLLLYNFSIKKNDNNTISIILHKYRFNKGLSLLIDNLDSLMIERHGWFPSKMIITNFSDMKNEYSYDESILLGDDYKYFEEVEIIYESKYDLEVELKNTLHHLSIQEYENDVIKKGLIPKSKSKLSKHLDRIYVCDDIDSCKNLISRMKLHYFDKKNLNKLNKTNTKWVIYKIDTTNLDIKLYKDPSYNNGYYIVDNIPPSNISIVDKEN
jgi:hypothetical protein